MSDINTVIISGRLGKTPVLRHTKKKRPVTNLDIASGSAYRNAAGDLVESTTWTSFSVWGKRANAIAKFLKKGDKVTVQGHMDNNDVVLEGGINHQEIVLVADNVIFPPKSARGESAPMPD